ncbi:hypothetical protein Tsubulata_007935, partial [Turnera subulata]
EKTHWLFDPSKKSPEPISLGCLLWPNISPPLKAPPLLLLLPLRPPILPPLHQTRRPEVPDRRPSLPEVSHLRVREEKRETEDRRPPLSGVPSLLVPSLSPDPPPPPPLDIFSGLVTSP